MQNYVSLIVMGNIRALEFLWPIEIKSWTQEEKVLLEKSQTIPFVMVMNFMVEVEVRRWRQQIGRAHV